MRDVDTPTRIAFVRVHPFAFFQMTFTVYESILLPMPQPDSPGVAIMWDLAAPFVAVSDDGRQTATLSSSQLEQCIEQLSSWVTSTIEFTTTRKFCHFVRVTRGAIILIV